MNHLTYAVQELTYRLHRTVAVIVAIGLALGVTLAIITISNGYLRALRVPFENIGSDLVLQRSISQGGAAGGNRAAFLPPFAQPITPAEVSTLQQTAGVDSAVGSLIFWSAEQNAMRVAMIARGEGALKKASETHT